VKQTSDVVHHEVTIRVKPAVRHVVTKGEHTLYADGRAGGSGGTLCEVSSEEAANEIAQALELFHAPRRYVVVQRSFEPGDCIVYYADSKAQAEQFQDVLQKHYQTDFRIYEQPLLNAREAEMHRASGAEPAVYMVVDEGEIKLTYGQLKTLQVSPERRIFHFSVPEGASEEEALALVKKTFEAYSVPTPIVG
jgi:hypothetical protein